MSNKKQTAVEWLEDKFAQFVMYEEGHFKAKPYTLTELYADFHQAKEHEKQQHIETFNEGYRQGEQDGRENSINTNDISNYTNAEQYYKEAYGN